MSLDQNFYLMTLVLKQLLMQFTILAQQPIQVVLDFFTILLNLLQCFVATKLLILRRSINEISDDLVVVLKLVINFCCWRSYTIFFTTNLLGFIRQWGYRPILSLYLYNLFNRSVGCHFLERREFDFLCLGMV